MKRVQELTSLAEFKANYDQISEHFLNKCPRHDLFFVVLLCCRAESYMKAKEQEVEKYKKYLNKAKKVLCGLPSSEVDSE